MNKINNRLVACVKQIASYLLFEILNILATSEGLYHSFLQIFGSYPSNSVWFVSMLKV